MICTNCGNRLEDGARFCVFCGSRVEAPIEKKNSKPAVAMVIIYIAIRLSGILAAFGIQILMYARSGVFDRPDLLRQVMIAMLPNLGINFLQLLAGAALLLAVTIARKKHLWKISGKEAIVVIIFALVMPMVSYLVNVILTGNMGMMGTSALVANSAASGIQLIFYHSSFIGFAALSVLILARTGAVKAAVIISTVLTCLTFIVCAGVFTVPQTLIHLFYSSSYEEYMIMAIPMIRFSAVSFMLTTMARLFGAAWFGRGIRMAGRGLAAILICSLGHIGLGLVSGYLYTRGLSIGAAFFGLKIEVVIPYIVSALIIMAGAIKHTAKGRENGRDR